MLYFMNLFKTFEKSFELPQYCKKGFWFLYDNGPRDERVKTTVLIRKEYNYTSTKIFPEVLCKKFVSSEMQKSHL